MSKVRSLPQAVGEHITDGTHVALCGFAITRNAIAAARAIASSGVRDLTLAQVIGGMETDLLAAAGCIRHLVYSGGSLDRFGNLYAVNRGINDGVIDVEEYSTLSLTLRLHAAALGLPYIPVRSMLGSELLSALVDRGSATIVSDPFTSTDVLVLSPLRPQVAVAHVDVADTAGNATVSGPLWALRETLFAAKTTILTAERIVVPGSLDPSAVQIPGASVAAVVEAPHGSRPTALYGHHDYDAETLHGYADASQTGDAAALAYLEERLLPTGSHS